MLKRLVKTAFGAVGLEVRRRRTPRPRVAKPSPYRWASPENLYEAVDFLRAAQLQHVHRALEERIRGQVRSGQPLRVAFLVNDCSKWNSDSLLAEMHRVGWSTRLYLCLSNARYRDHEERATAYLAERTFFAGIDRDLVDLYDEKTDLQLPVEDVLTADLVFYQQPWGMLDFPRRLAGRALGAYLHYGFMLMANHGQHYHIGGFHPYLWRYFAQTEAHRLLHLAHDPSAHERAVVTGYPKLDVYHSEPVPPDSAAWPAPRAAGKRIIYAPHHAMSAKSLGMSTFAWTHQAMLELARRTPRTQWVYKPHALLQYKVASAKVMSRAEYQRYEAAWAELPNAAVYAGGRYFDLFRSSDALVTDCGSFLAEYLPTGNPILWLASAESVGFNVVGESLAEAYYRIGSLADLEAAFQRVVVAGEDPLRPARARAAERLFPVGGRSAAAIVEHLAERLAG